MGSTIKKLGDIVEINDASWSKNLNWNNLLYLDTANITNGIIGDLVSYQIKTDEIPSRARRLVKEGDIVYSTVRPNQRHFGILENIPTNLVVSTGFTTIRSKLPTTYPTKFIYYLLTQNHITNYLQGIAENNTSAYPSLRPQDILDLEFEFPDINDQLKTVSLISKIDKKFQLNQEINLTLEKIAKAIFKSWFIDFDPVRAKVEGRSTGLPNEISDLFPSEFVESELGQIPAKWSIKKLEKISSVLLGGTPSRNNPLFWGGDIPWINSGEVNKFRISEPTEFITKEGLAGSSTKLLSKNTTVIAITGATLGQVSYLELDTCANQSVIGVAPHNEFEKEWVYFSIRGNIQNLINRQTGGAQQHINRNDVLDLKILTPSEELIVLFHKVCEPIFKKISINIQQTKNLTTIRDLLLPKLMSGELQIPDAEKFLYEVDI